MILRVTTQPCHSTEGRWLVNHVKGQSHQAQLTKGKEKDVSKKNFTMYIAPFRPKTRRRFEDRELNQARSKPDTVNQPVRTARIFVHHYNSTQYCNTETVFIYIPLLQTNITSQMWPTGGKGGVVYTRDYGIMYLFHDRCARANMAYEQRDKLVTLQWEQVMRHFTPDTLFINR